MKWQLCRVASSTAGNADCFGLDDDKLQGKAFTLDVSNILYKSSR
jgi:hypothetical protein